MCLITYSLDTVYRVALQLFGITHSYISYPLRIPLTAFFFSNQCLQIYLLTKYLCPSSQKKMPLFFKMIVPSYFGFLAANLCINLIGYPAHMKKKNNTGKLLIATFSSLLGVVVKAASRICVQKLYNITHPGYSYIIFITGLFCRGSLSSSFASGSWQFTSHSFTWNNSRRCRNH